MPSDEITRLCRNQQWSCRQEGHRAYLPARRVSTNGAVQFQMVCARCGGKVNSVETKQSQPQWKEGPVIRIGPQHWQAGCRCQGCVDQQKHANEVRESQTQREQYRARFRPAWLLTAWRMREDRTRRFPDWAEFLEYQRSEQWRNIRKIVRERFDGRCAACNSADGLEVHHRTYERVGMEEIGDLTLLCTECHSLLHAEWNYVLDLPSPIT